MAANTQIDAVVIQGKGVDTARAGRIAEKFEAKLITSLPSGKDQRFFLIDKNGISFVNGDKILKGDFTKLLPRVTGGHLQHELLLKAAGQDLQGTTLRAVDATAGLGEDAFIFAAAGYTIDLCEHNPITALLLHDALIRGKSNARLRDIISRMTLHNVDSKQFLRDIVYRPDLIYLDPMFPEKKKSAESKAKLQMLHTIEAPCSDEEELLSAAICADPVKIMIKRPPGCPWLAGIRPAYSLERKAVRFDCILPGHTHN